MKTVPAALSTHLSGETTTLATLWRLERRDGIVLGFTDHDQDIVLDGLTYRAASGYTRTAISSDATLSVDNMDLDGLLSSGAVEAADIRAGLFDWAALLIRLVNYADLTQGSVILRRGYLGEFTLKAGVFTTELRGLSQALSRNFIGTTTPDCRADLGDSRCKVDLTLHRETGTIASIATQRRIFTATLTGARADGYFNGGLLTWTSGLNVGLKQEIREHVGSTLTLYLPSGHDLAVSDAFTVQAGCDKLITTCRDKFSNVVNNRSFPFIPGTDAIVRTPDVKPQ
jgi:uncharacterized phage protein (TIGR02218 family)